MLLEETVDHIGVDVARIDWPVDGGHGSGPSPPPSWLPIIGTTKPTIFADFAVGNYWFNNTSYATITAWMAATGGTYTNSTGKYVTNSSGELATVAANTLPFDYAWNGQAFVPTGLLLEGTSTNLNLESASLSNIAWTWQDVTLTQNVIGPDGVTNSGWTLAAITVTTGNYFYQIPSGMGSSGVTNTIYAKYNGTSTYLMISLQSSSSDATFFNLQTGTIGIVGGSNTAKMVPLANGWYRCSITLPTGAVAGPAYGPADVNGTVGAAIGHSILVYGPQLENLAFPTSYIPTTSATAARSADSLILTPTGGFSTTAETIYSEFYGNNQINGGGLVDLRPTALSDDLILYVAEGGTGGASGYADFSSPLNAITQTCPPNQSNKLATSASIATGLVAVLNAGVASSVSTITSMPSAFNSLAVNHDEYSAPFFGDIAQIGAWPVAATAAQLQTLTTPSPTLVPQIGGVNPFIWADFAAGKYWFGQNYYTSVSSWMTATNASYSNSTGKYVTNSSGQLAQVAANTLPFDYSWNGSSATPRGLLLEGASSNEVTFSNAFGTSWGLTSATAAQNVTGPDGVSNSGFTVTATANLSQVGNTASGSLSSGNFSLFVKKGSGASFVYLQMNDSGSPVGACITSFDLTNGTIGTQNTVLQGTTLTLSGATITDLANGWYRIATNFSTTSGPLSNIFFGLADADASRTCTNGDTLLVYGAQIEALAFPTSYIPTTSSPATRSADAFTLTPTGGFSTTAETIYTSFYNEGNEDAPPIIQQFTNVLGLSDGSSNNQLNLGIQSGVDAFAYVQPPGTVLTGSVLLAGLNKEALSASVANGYNFVVNAGTTTAGSVASMPSALTVLGIGLSLGIDNIYGDVAQIGTWSLAATAAQLQALT